MYSPYLKERDNVLFDHYIICPVKLKSKASQSYLKSVSLESKGDLDKDCKSEVGQYRRREI